MFRTEHIPCRWLLVEVGDLHKVFAVWTGGYLDGDAWRMNSGIESVEVDGDYFLMHGFSGSVYRCHKDQYGTTAYGSFILADLTIRAGVKSLKGYEEYMEEALKS